ncbi:activating transcription factor 7-interacting protein 1 isoform 7-T9 [Ammospiza maritima maritima]
MDSTEEPQKKVFKARKTMRVSDRQQLEAVYKVKEELLKTTEVKLVNGKHENGDSDINSPLSNTDCTEVKKEINGVVDLCVNSEEGRTACDEISETKSPENRAGNMANDIESKPPVLSLENVAPEQAKDTDIAVKCEAENGVGSSKDNFHEENNKKDHLDQRKNDIPSEGESKPVCDISDSSEEKGETNYLPVNSSSSGEEKRTEEVTAEEIVGEAAISSSMEADQEKQEGSAEPAETTVSKTIDEPSESILDNTDSMETDDIIPILEKLAPAEDDLSCFSKSSLLPVDDTVADLEEKIDNCLGSPSKQESNESLPKEAFLVLSDEDDPCDEKEELVEGILPNKSSLPEEVEGERKKECEDKEEEEAHKEEEIQIEKNEASKRKRSKSEDMDNVRSKHRRYMGEDYEAELQVKITARKDVDLKLQKIIQRLLEEKLTALQCAVFDKTLADLKTRMEKVECNKRHKTVLTEMQAKIARLTKRVGAAKEDLKKRQENVANAPVSPGKAAPDPANVNNATCRNAGTVRQMLESKRNVGESTPATFQAPANPVGTPGLYNATASRAPLQMKLPLSAFNSTAPTEPPPLAAPKIENQTSRPPTDTSSNKRPAEGTTQSGKFTGSESGGVIDLTLDEEDDSCSQADGKKQKQNQSQAPVPGLSIPTQPLTRPLQPLPPLQPSPVQQPGVPTSGPSQTTIHVLPTASTAVNVTHRPVAPANPKLPIPRTPANHQVVYTTIPAPPAQNPVRGAVMTSPGLRPVTPQTGGVTVRMPQTTYVVNNGLALGSGAPQLTVHHRPPPQAHTEPPRPIHPAPLPEAPQPPRLPPEAANTSPPQKPQLKLARVQSQNGIVLSWSVMEVDRSCATVDSYHLYAYHEDPSATMASQWKKIGEVKALPLPMACTLTQFVSGSKYYFAVRAKDVYGRFGPFCDPQSTDVISSQSS